mmetsp:Transcript_5253/g.7891  ORF Transcript_5253/g.7891 Transcript_5253/m.7891 type:complete len:292 (+) Transcript_5253:3-878(+)
MASSDLESLRNTLNGDYSITQKTNAVFDLRTIGTPEVYPLLTEAYYNNNSDLLRHEICYVLGQIGNEDCYEFLSGVLKDETDSVINRHEAAEAMGAIGSAKFLDILRQYLDSQHQEISETCQLAIERINWLRSKEKVKNSDYLSVDPTPPFSEDYTIEQLTEIFNDTTQSLWDRYRALFSLRDIGTPEAVLVIAQGLNNPSFSNLFRHEIAFVFGQLREKAKPALPALVQALENPSDAYIVRHESAEAIGSITDQQEYLQILEKHKRDPAEPVASSCYIALDISDYWFSSN